MKASRELAEVACRALGASPEKVPLVERAITETFGGEQLRITKRASWCSMSYEMSTSSVADIMRALGVSRRTAYYFKSKFSVVQKQP